MRTESKEEEAKDPGNNETNLWIQWKEIIGSWLGSKPRKQYTQIRNKSLKNMFKKKILSIQHEYTTKLEDLIIMKRACISSIRKKAIRHSREGIHMVYTWNNLNMAWFWVVVRISDKKIHLTLMLGCSLWVGADLAM